MVFFELLKLAVIQSATRRGDASNCSRFDAAAGFDAVPHADDVSVADSVAQLSATAAAGSGVAGNDWRLMILSSRQETCDFVILAFDRQLSLRRCAHHRGECRASSRQMKFSAELFSVGA